MRVSLIIFALSLWCCSDSSNHQQQRHFNIFLKYGPGRDELNTFQNTIGWHASPPDTVITIPLTLSDNELSQIEKMIYDIRYFSYPDTFHPWLPNFEMRKVTSPHDKYFFRVQSGSRMKTLFWEDFNPEDTFDPRAVALRYVIKFIRGIVESKIDNKRLPKHAVYL